jgi:hypothetical protein
MNSNIDLQKISPKMCGIIWLEEKELNFNSDSFTQINYLLDNLLVLEQKKHKESSLVQNKNLHHYYSLFWSSSFSHPFIVIHINLTELSSKDPSFNHLNYVLTEFIQTLKKVYPQFDLNEIGFISSNLDEQKTSIKKISAVCQKHQLNPINIKN